MSEQAPNSPHADAVANIENMFREKEGLPVAEKSRPRNEDGTFAPQGRKEEPVQAEAQQTEPVEDTEGQEQAQESQPQSEEVDVDFEIGGEKKTYRIPKEISDRFIQHADYTRKTQDLAELRRFSLAEKESLALERGFEQSVSQERQQKAFLDHQIDQFKNVNWATIEDTGQLIKLREQLNQLKEMRASVEDQIKAKRGDFDAKIKSLSQEATSAGLKFIQQRIKSYDEKAQKAIHDYGRSEGYTQEELSKIMDPRIVVTLWKAAQWDNLQSSKAGVMNKAQQAAPTVRPGATQKTVSQVQRLDKAFKDAKTSKEKASTAEDYFAARLSGR